MDNRQAERSYRRFVVGLCAAVVITILVVGLWPFHSPSNGAHWIVDAPGVQFGQDSTVFSDRPFSGDRSSPAAASIEIWVTPENVTGDGTMLAFDSGAVPRLPLALRQYRSAVALQTSVVDERGALRRPWLKMDNALSAGKRTLITITAREGLTSIYIDGRLRGTSSELRIRGVDFASEMIVGNSTVDDLWRGTISGLAMYPKELDTQEVESHFESWTADRRPELGAGETPMALYLFNERRGRAIHSEIASAPILLIPESYSVLHPAFLGPAWESGFAASRIWTRWWYWKDMIINIAGFMPLGFLLTAYFGSEKFITRHAMTVIVLGCLLSFAIEALQHFLPTRDSSMDDLINNTIGTTVGVLLYSSSGVRAMWFRIVEFLGIAPRSDEDLKAEIVLPLSA